MAALPACPDRAADQESDTTIRTAIATDTRIEAGATGTATRIDKTPGIETGKGTSERGITGPMTATAAITSGRIRQTTGDFAGCLATHAANVCIHHSLQPRLTCRSKHATGSREGPSRWFAAHELVTLNSALET